MIHESDKKFMELLGEGKVVTVVRSSITYASGKYVHLSNGTRLNSDTTIFATGWDISTNAIFDPEDRIALSLVTSSASVSDEYLSYWKALDSVADHLVLETNPILKTAPKAIDRANSLLPYRVFRQIVPSTLAGRRDRSLIPWANYQCWCSNTF